MTFVKAQVVINEYSCSNLAVFADNNGKYEDWVELYNTGLTPVDLSGYCLSDNVAKTKKWKIPVSSAAIIPANGFLRFWDSPDFIGSWIMAFEILGKSSQYFYV